MRKQLLIPVFCTLMVCMLVHTGCGPAQHGSQQKTIEKENKAVERLTAKGPWYHQYNYDITDGNNNFYSFGYNWFIYHPVKPANSNSGLYDGGQEVIAKDIILADAYSLLIDALQQAYIEKTDHAAAGSDKINKGDMRVSVLDESNKINEFTLKMQSPSLLRVEKQLVHMKEELLKAQKK